MIQKFVRALGKFFKELYSSPTQTVREQVIDPLTIPMHDRVRNVYANLDVAAFADYKKSHGLIGQVTLVHPTVDLCIADIAGHIQVLERSGYVQPSTVNYTAIQRPFNRFFLTKDGFYLPSMRDAVQELVDVTTDLCKAIEEAKVVDYETKSYNLRMLNSLLHVLLDLGETLTDISQGIRTSR